MAEIETSFFAAYLDMDMKSLALVYFWSTYCVSKVQWGLRKFGVLEQVTNSTPRLIWNSA